MPATIVLLDDNKDLLELMQDLLQSSLKVVCKCFESVLEFQKHPEEILRSEVVILDINLGADVPSGIDAFHWLKDQGFQGKVLFFTGHARSYLQHEFGGRNGAEILEKPADVDKLIAVISRVLNESS